MYSQNELIELRKNAVRNISWAEDKRQYIENNADKV